MAHGLPDYYRGVDIAYQALAQLLVRTTYGAARHEHGSLTVTPTEDNLLKRVEGKGVIYGGNMYLNHDAEQIHSRPILVVDDVDLSWCTFYNLYDYRINKPWSAVMYQLGYDAVDHKHSVGISPNITFESSFELRYKENQNTNPMVRYYVFYALIT